MRIPKRLIRWKYSYLYLISIIGVLILFFLGSETLSCQRINSPKIDCQIFQTDAWGLANQKTFYLKNLKTVRLEERIKETLDYLDLEIGDKTITKRPIYGVVLEFDEGKEMVFQGYGYQRQPKQLVAATIQEFLNEPKQRNLILKENRFWLSFFSLSLMIVPLVFILKTEFFSPSK